MALVLIKMCGNPITVVVRFGEKLLFPSYCQTRAGFSPPALTKMATRWGRCISLDHDIEVAWSGNREDHQFSCVRTCHSPCHIKSVSHYIIIPMKFQDPGVSQHNHPYEVSGPGVSRHNHPYGISRLSVYNHHCEIIARWNITELYWSYVSVKWYCTKR